MLKEYILVLEMFLAMHNTRVARVQDGVEIINRIDL